MRRKDSARPTADIKTAQDLPVFSDAQLTTFKSDYVDSLDEARAVLDETNREVAGKTSALAKSIDD